MQGGGPFQRDFRKSMFHDGRLYAQWIERLEEFGINVRTVCLSVHLSMFVSLSVCCSVYQPVCLQFCLHQPSSILLMESLISLISPHMHTHTPHTLPLSSHSHSTHTPHTSTPITPHTPHTPHIHTPHPLTPHTLHTLTPSHSTLHTLLNFTHTHSMDSYRNQRKTMLYLNMRETLVRANDHVPPHPFLKGRRRPRRRGGGTMVQ